VLRPAEHLAAQRALERLLSAVDSRVAREVSDPREPLVADRTLERFLARVTAVVDRQRRRAGEALSALGAEMFHLVTACGIGLVLSVNRLMPKQPPLGDKSLVAY